VQDSVGTKLDVQFVVRFVETQINRIGNGVSIDFQDLIAWPPPKVVTYGSLFYVRYSDSHILLRCDAPNYETSPFVLGNALSAREIGGNKDVWLIY